MSLGFLSVFFESEAHNLILSCTSITFGLLLIMRQVDFASNLEVTAGSVVDSCSLSLLALFLGKCTLLVDVVASSKLFVNCFRS